MSRTSIGQVAAIANTNCNNPRTDEATKWTQVQTSLKSVMQQGQTLVSAWGMRNGPYRFPICGYSPYPDNDYALNGPGGFSHEIPFEQVSLKTSGAVTVADKFYLTIRYIICNFQGYTDSGSGITADIFGRIRVTLSNSGGTQVLCHAASTSLISAAGYTGLTAVSVGSNSYAEAETIYTGDLTSSVTPATGASYDSKLILELQDTVYDPDSTPAAMTFDPTTIPAGVPPYIGIDGVTLRIFNPVA